MNSLFVEDHEKMKSCLIILYSTKTSDIYKSLDLLKFKKILNIQKNEIECLKIEDSNIEIILSDKSGVGKSTKIKSDIELSRKEYTLCLLIVFLMKKFFN